MTVKLGTNITAQFLRQQFGRAAEDLSTATQRLASGQRIVKPSDDPGGLAIAEKLSNDARIYTQGVRNLNTGISAISIAEGAMNEMVNILDRIDELAKQSQNGTLTQNQRNVMQQEVTALQSEWNRIIESTTFNGTQLLTGNDTRLVLQGSEGTSGTLAVQFGEAQLTGGIEGFAEGTTRVSTTSSGGEALGGNSYSGAISADGRYMVFSSSATNLVAGDTNGIQDLFRKDLLTGAITRINTDSSGNQVTSGIGTTVGGISADGRYVVFGSQADNLVAGVTGGTGHVYMKDTLTGVTTLISSDSAGNQATGAISAAQSMSADGRYVVFSSGATNLVAGDTNGATDMFVKDTLTGITTRVSVDSSGAQANAASTGGDISADGRYVVFESTASNLVAGDTNGVGDIFVKDLLTGEVRRVNTSSSGAEATGFLSNASSISADGKFVTFTSRASNLVAGDTNALQDIFIKDLTTGETRRVSTTSSGAEANGLSLSSDISADGRYVVITSQATNLATGASGRQVYRKDMLTGEILLLSSDSAGVPVGGSSSNPSISADGRHTVFSSSGTTLVSGDTNGFTDAFLRDLTTTGVQELSGLVVSDRVSAGVTLTLTARARTELTEYRASLGTSLTRINSFVNTLNGATLNLQEAAARIKDADIAEEASRAMAARMRQEVAANLLKQVNVQPSLALMLLKG